MNIHARMTPEAEFAYVERRFGYSPKIPLLLELRKMAKEGLVSTRMEDVDGKNKKVVEVDLETLRIVLGRREAKGPFLPGVRIRLEMDKEAKRFICREARIPYDKLIRVAAKLIKNGLLYLGVSIADLIATAVDGILTIKTDLLMARRLVAVATDGRK